MISVGNVTELKEMPPPKKPAKKKTGENNGIYTLEDLKECGENEQFELIYSTVQDDIKALQDMLCAIRAVLRMLQNEAFYPSYAHLYIGTLELFGHRTPLLCANICRKSKFTKVK